MVDVTKWERMRSKTKSSKNGSKKASKKRRIFDWSDD